MGRLADTDESDTHWVISEPVPPNRVRAVCDSWLEELPTSVTLIEPVAGVLCLTASDSSTLSYEALNVNVPNRLNVVTAAALQSNAPGRIKGHQYFRSDVLGGEIDLANALVEVGVIDDAVVCNHAGHKALHWIVPD